MSDEPSPRELDWRVNDLRDEMRRGFDAINARLDRVPTSELLMAHLQGWQKQLDTVRDEQVSQRVYVDQQLNEIRADVERERTDREDQHKADVDSRRWVIGVVALPILLSLLAVAAATGVIG